MSPEDHDTRRRLPEWLRRGVVDVETTRPVRKLLSELRLNTVCDGARCPNKCECYSSLTATFLILGSKCTRNCRFCAVDHDKKPYVDPQEPENVAKAVQILGLKYVVITSVTRDDLEDGGAGHFVKTVQAIRQLTPEVAIELLVPDFQGNQESIRMVLDAGINVFNHNIETVERLYNDVRPEANYYRSLELLKYAKEFKPEILTKSGLMIGLGEDISEIEKVCQDLRAYQCDILTIGQYIQPTKASVVVKKYYTEDDFDVIKQMTRQLDFKKVIAGPLVRSSYKAFEAYSQ